MNGRQHVWLRPAETSFQVPCEACLTREHRGVALPVARFAAPVIEGTLRPDADVGFTTCRYGHRVVVHRVGRAPAVPR